jgi:hypothetical protein
MFDASTNTDEYSHASSIRQLKNKLYTDEIVYWIRDKVLEFECVHIETGIVAQPQFFNFVGIHAKFTVFNHRNYIQVLVE